MIGPSSESVDFFLRAGPAVREFPHMGIGEPGRHFAQKHGFLDRFGPRLGLIVREQRKRSSLPTAMASLTALLQYGQNIPGKGHRLAGRSHEGGSEQDPRDDGFETH